MFSSFFLLPSFSRSERSVKQHFSRLVFWEDIVSVTNDKCFLWYEDWQESYILCKTKLRSTRARVDRWWRNILLYVFWWRTAEDIVSWILTTFAGDLGFSSVQQAFTAFEMFQWEWVHFESKVHVCTRL